MNKQQRKRLEEVTELLEKAKEIISEIQSEEQYKFDNMPEGLQQTEANQKLEDNANDLGDAESNLDDCIRAVDDCINR